jgi:transposase
MNSDYRERTSSEKREFWGEQIRFWQESGLSQSEYCKRHGIRSSQWFYWRRRCRNTEEGLTLVPVRLPSLREATSKTPAIRVITPNGFTIELDCDASLQFIPQLVREVAAI